MIRVYVRAELGDMTEYLATDDPVEAEAQYLRLIRDRTDEPMVVVIDPGCPGGSILPAHYRINHAWRGPRELDADRRKALWEPGGCPGPIAVRAIPVAAGVTRATVARAIGRSENAMNRWCAPAESSDHTQMPWSVYTAALVVLDLHPDYKRR